MSKHKSLQTLLLKAYLQDRGFTLPIALGMGLIIAVMGVMMMVRSQSDSTMANAQKTANKGVSATEIASARYQQLLGKYPILAAFPFCSNNVGASATCPDSYNEATPVSQASWKNIGPLVANGKLLQSTTTGCAGNINDIKTEIASFATTAWQDVSTGNTVAGQYRLVNFTFTPAADAGAANSTPTDLKPVRIGNGILTVEGKVNLATGNTDDTSTAKSQVQVQVPVTPLGPLPFSFPGVWVKTGDVGDNNEFTANVLVACNGNPSVANLTAGNDPATGLPWAAYGSSATMPPVPSTCDVSGYVNCRPTTFASTNNLGNVTTDLTLPRTTDTAETLSVPVLNAQGQQVDANGDGNPDLDTYRVYKYRLGDMNMSGNKTVTINTGAYSVVSDGTTANTPDNTQTPIKVFLYTDGNVNLSGNATLAHTCPVGVTKCSLTDLHMYGYNLNGAASPEICLNGNGTIGAFILAPTYKAGVSGSGSSAGAIDGTVWVNSWSTGSGCGSNTSNVVAIQTAGWSEQAAFTDLSSMRKAAVIKPLASWTRREYGTN
jgi:hypothetical protein